jgi:pimeloyl-ACP methyl ester carboxylesterase
VLLKRPDDVEIYWEERGEGPLVLFAMQFFGYPETFEDLIGDLSADHRTVVYHLRGTGLSTRRGPYRLETDADDLGALLEEAGGDAVVIGMADGSNRAVKVAAVQPELVRAVVSPGGNPAGRRAAQGTEALASSDSVLEALQSMLDTDYRTALRTMLDTANPQLDDDGLRERLDRTIEHCPYEAAAPRLRDWIADDSTEQARLVGDRLWVLEHGKNPWFPIEVARRTRELLPQAQVMEVADGPLSRPDLTSAVVREITSPARVAPTAGWSEGS